MRVRIPLVIPALATAMLALTPSPAAAASAPAVPRQARAVPAHATLGVALSDGSLIPFDVANPAATDAPLAITGVSAGETIVGIDFRPQNGFLYGLGYNSTSGTVQLYHVSHRTGQATAIGLPASFVAGDGATPAPVTGTNFGFDVNPTVDRIRVVTDAGQNFRLNPNNGAPVDGDAAAAGTQMDGAINGATTTVDASAYTNNQQNATVTTLYSLSAATNQLFIQNPPNNGTQAIPVIVTLNGQPLDFVASNGFDIQPGINVASANAVATGAGLAALTVGGYTGLYTVDLITGAAALVGPIGNGGTVIQGLAVRRAVVAPGGLPSVALDASGTLLIRFDTAAPSTTATMALTGIAAGEVVAGIDWRPQTGQLFGVGVNDVANTATVYLIDAQTGAATAVGPTGQIAFVGADGTTPVDLPAATAGYGFDFNPTVDRIRIVTSTGLNFRANPNTGGPVDGNTAVSGIQTDGSINGLPPGATGVSGAAYTNSFGQSLTGGVTTQYTVDATSDTLFIQNPPNNGTQTSGVAVTTSLAPLDFGQVNGFDIPAETMVAGSGSPASGRAFAAFTVGGSTQLYRLDLGTGQAVAVGPVGSGVSLGGLAVGDGQAEAPPAAPPGFQALTPERVFDTRPGSPDGLRPVDKRKVGGANELRVKVTDLAGRVPASGVGAVSLNVTVTEPDAAGFVTVYPCDTRPLASSVNFTAGRNVANAVIAPVSAAGEVCFYSFANTHLLADINGYFPTGSAFAAVSPTRVFDTRPGSPDGLRTVEKRKVGGGYELMVQLTDLAGRVPALGVGAVSLNVTSTEQVADGFVTAYPCDSRPLASSVNYVAGSDVANAVIVPVSPSGMVCFFAFADTHLLADINGYFPTGAGFAAVSPARVFDTRPGAPPALRVVEQRKVGNGYELSVQLTDLAGRVPASGVAAVSLNVTATESDGDGYVTVYPCGVRPLASSVNFVAGQTVPNAVIAPVSPTGDVCFFAFAPTHLLADVNGYFPTTS